MWPWLHADMLLEGVDLCDFVEMDARDFFDVVDALFVRDAVRDGEMQGAVTKARTALDKVYSRTSYSLSSDSGSSNDDAGTELDPFGQPVRDLPPLPSPTLPDDNGYPGLEAPVG